jgi:hypothetical protein
MLWSLTLMQDRLLIGDAAKWWFVGIVTLYLLMSDWRRPMLLHTTFTITSVVAIFALAQYSAVPSHRHNFNSLYYGLLIACCFIVYRVRQYVPVSEREPIDMDGFH